MPINPNIALQVQPVQMENPLNMMAKYAAMQQAQQEQQMNALKMQEYQRDVQEQNALRQYLAGGMPDREEGLLRYGAAGRGAYESLLKGRKETREAESAAALRKKYDAETVAKTLEVAQERLGFAAANAASDEIVAGTFARLAQEKHLTPDEAQWLTNDVLKLDPQARAQRLTDLSLTAAKRAEPLLAGLRAQAEYPYRAPTAFTMGTGVEGQVQHAVMQPRVGATGKPGVDIQPVGPVEIKRPMKTEVNVNTPVAKNLAGEVGKRAYESVSRAEGAAESMANANMVREALNKGLVIAGPLAGPRTKFAQVMEVAGVGDKEQLAATRTAITGLASLTLDSRAALKGQGQITDFETKLLEKARSGSIEDMTVAELQQVVDISQRLSKRLWSNHQDLLNKMKDDPNAQDSLRYYEPAAKMPEPLGAGATAAEKKRPPLKDIFGK